jgi:transcriptional regulator with XRE-family HTH domain
MEIKDRIIEFLRAENISSANFAQEIGVQPSGISHIISGRNKPSLDFIVKMLNRYPSLSTDWILFGRGKMLKESIPGDLFSGEQNSDAPVSNNADLFEVQDASASTSLKNSPSEDKKDGPAALELLSVGSKAARIVIFHRDNTFREYFPG